jgi:hypothetical protein
LAAAAVLLASCEWTLDFDSTAPESTEPGSTDCVSDSDGDAICDRLDMCLLDGPLAGDVRNLASNQVLTISNVQLDGSTNTLLGVEAGSTINIQYDWTYNSYSRCCECTTYISVGFTESTSPDHCQPAFTGCIGEGHYETTLTAPSEPGTYYIGFRMHREATCPTSWNDPPLAQTFAAICVN